MGAYLKQYKEMNDGELVTFSAKLETLVPEARDDLMGELSLRQLEAKFEPKISLETMPLASRWKRLLAFIVDMLLLQVVSVVAAIVSGFPIRFNAEGIDPRSMPAVSLYADLLFILLIPAFWSSIGATPGKLLLHIKVVDAVTGNTPGVIRSYVRLFGYWVSSVVIGIGFLWSFFDKKRRGWHDILANTIVVEQGNGRRNFVRPSAP